MTRLTGPQRVTIAVNRCKRLDAKQCHALLAMGEWADWDDFTLYPSLASLQIALRASRNTVIRRLDELEKIGAITIVRGGGGRGSTHRITINIGWLEGDEPGLFGAQPTASKADRKGPPQDCTLIDQKGSNSEALRVPKSQIRVPSRWDLNSKKHSETQPPPPRARGSVPDFEAEPRGGRGGGGGVQSDGTKATPVATTVRRVAEVAAKPTREANPAERPPSAATNAPGANPLADAIEALGPSRRIAAELASLPHVTPALVQFWTEQAAIQTPRRPDRWAAAMLRLPPDEVSQFRPWLRKHEARAAAIDRVRRIAIRVAIGFAHHHRDDAVYGRFCLAVLDAIRDTWKLRSEAVREAQLPRELLNPNASPLAVLRSLALSCGHDIEIPTDTLRMPERDERPLTRDGASHAV